MASSGTNPTQRQPAKAAVGPSKNRHVYITERKRYFKRNVPTIDTVVEQDKLCKQLAVARHEGDWKLEAQVLMRIGQVLKWRGQEAEGSEFQAQAASILRAHTFADEESATAAAVDA